RLHRPGRVCLRQYLVLGLRHRRDHACAGAGRGGGAGAHDADQAGYWWELSMRQIETSRTLVFDAPRRARGFFEALVADNLDLGRPDEVQLIFGRKIRSDTQGEFATKVVTRGVDVIVNVFYKHSRIK